MISKLCIVVIARGFVLLKEGCDAYLIITYIINVTQANMTASGEKYPPTKTTEVIVIAVNNLFILGASLVC